MANTTMYIRVKQALNWIKRNNNMLQKDIAKEMGMNEASFTRALARVRDKDDEDFVIKFHSIASNISLDYLLNGTGELLNTTSSQQNPPLYSGTGVSHYPTAPHSTGGMVSESPTPTDIPVWADTLLQILSKQISENESLLSELRNSIQDVKELEKQLSDLLCDAKK